MTAPDWEVELSAAAEADFREIILWTRRRFGGSQAVAYGGILKAALTALQAGPDAIGVKRRDDIGPGYRTLHVARNRHRGRHFILFRAGAAPELRLVRVVRILHDAMDPVRHLPDRDET